MPRDSEIPLIDMIDLATESSAEIAALGTRLFDYETGNDMLMTDEKTALFLASSRSIVLEIARRLRECERKAD